MDGLADVDIIKLQLRKPKSWNWELTTSKSSPHIALPTIQLYNSKGRLLIEAKDEGMKRLSWSNVDRSNKRASNQVQRCRSDIIKHPLVNSNKNSISRCATTNKIPERGFENCHENKIAKENRNIKKSRSEVLHPTPSISYQQRYKHKMVNGESNKRSRSDALERLYKYNEESLKRAVADGYQNFLNLRERTQNDCQKKEKRKSYPRAQCGIAAKVDDSSHKLEVNHFTHKKYKTRTSSAGTLIIDESFNNSYRRRPTTRAEQNSKRITNGIDETITEKQNIPSSAAKENHWKVINENPDMLFESNSTPGVPDSCNYIVQEPITPVRDNGMLGDVVNDDHKREKRRTKLRRRCSIDSTSSSTAEKRNRYKGKEDNCKGKINFSLACNCFF